MAPQAASPDNKASNLDDGRDAEKQDGSDPSIKILRLRIVMMFVLGSMGGCILGYDIGQISGFLAMLNFRETFGDAIDPKTGEPAFTSGRKGAIVSLFCVGTMLGSLLAAPIADRFGRKPSITVWSIVYICGVLIQIATNTTWYQVPVGRVVGGLGVGGLSVITPCYQSETAPKMLRGTMISAFQLFVTLGIFLAYVINYCTESINGPASWKITLGIGFFWPTVLGIGIQFFPESPRWDYRHGEIARARTTIAKIWGVPEDHAQVNREVREIQEKFDAESATSGSHSWKEIFTGPRMTYRTLLGVAIQAFQQLTGANFFFFYGTTIFKSTGIQNSFITAIMLGAVNFVSTFPGLWFAQRFGRRVCLIAGALWMGACFLVNSSVGHFALDRANPENTPAMGAVMIAVSCLFIAAFASTWGPLAWAVVGELYPTKYRAQCMGLATASNWIWNFLISFFTPYIQEKIDFRYGYVFSGCCTIAATVVYFFLCESQGRTLEEIDTMYLLHVKPTMSSKWVAPPREELTTADSGKEEKDESHTLKQGQ